MSDGARQGPPRWAIGIALIALAAIAALYIFAGEPVVEAPVYDGPYDVAPVVEEMPPPVEDAAPASDETESPADDATPG